MSALVLFAAMGLAVQVAACPSECFCRETQTSLTLTCSGSSSSLLPDFPLTTTSLTIHDSPLYSPPTLTAPNLVELTITDCSIDSLANVTFDELNHLRNLDLSRNLITNVSEETFNLTSLRLLDLSHNVIQVIKGSPFRTLCALQVLNLSGNAIDHINVTGFYGLGSLQSLDLSANALDKLEDQLFVSLVSLQHLNLSGNQLETLGEDCFGSLLRLQQLDVSSNSLKHVAPGTLQALPSLSRLLLAGNPALGSEKEAALLVGTGRRLQTVDASRIGLKHVPAALTHSVRTLRLAGNTIHNIRCGDLDSYPLLQLLDLTGNILEEVEEDALGRLEMLAVLYLTDNKLHAIPRSLPDGLKILHLEFNQIEQIVSGDLLGLPKLEVLLLNDNAIKVVQEGAFSQVSSLVTLDLSHNPISILPSGTLAGPAQLQMLRLSELTVDPPAEDMAFPVPAPEHLVRLDLSNSVGLARQLLADTAALAAFRELQDLNLANTDLTNIRSDLLHFLPQLRDFHLTGNRLNCTGLLWLALWMRRQDQPEYRKVACASPPELYGTLLVDLQDTVNDEYHETTALTTATYKTTSDARPVADEYLQDIENQTTVTLAMGEQTKSAELQIFASAFNDIRVNESATEHPTVRGLQNTFKSPSKEKANWNGNGTGNEAASREAETAVHRSALADVAADRVHLFPIAAAAVADKTEASAVTDGHIGEINPSDNRIATEPSNYKANAIQTPAGKVALAGNKDPEHENTLTAINSQVEGVTTSSATVTLRDTEYVTRRYANEADNFFHNKSSYRDNVTSKVPANILMGLTYSHVNLLPENTETKMKVEEEVNVNEAKEKHKQIKEKENGTENSNKATTKTETKTLEKEITEKKDDVKEEDIVRVVGVEVEVKEVVNGSNATEASGGEMSMYSSSRQPRATEGIHPGMLILLGAVMGAGVALFGLLVHLRSRRKRTQESGRYDRHQDIEVNSLASVHELW